MKSLSRFPHTLLRFYHYMCQFGPLGSRCQDKFRSEKGLLGKWKIKCRESRIGRGKSTNCDAELIVVKVERKRSRIGQSKPPTKTQTWQKIGQPYVYLQSKYCTLGESYLEQEWPDPSVTTMLSILLWLYNK